MLVLKKLNYSPEYIRQLPMMQEKIGQEIDTCTDAEQQENLIDLYNNIELEIDAIKILLKEDLIRFTKNTGIKNPF